MNLPGLGIISMEPESLLLKGFFFLNLILTKTFGKLVPNLT